MNTQMHPTANVKYSMAADKFRPLYFIAPISFGRRPRGLPPIGLGAWSFIADGLCDARRLQTAFDHDAIADATS